jgi:hypothetical protein
MRASNFLERTKLGVSFVKLSCMESKSLFVILGSVTIEIENMQLLFHYKCDYSLVIRENLTASEGSRRLRLPDFKTIGT